MTNIAVVLALAAVWISIIIVIAITQEFWVGLIVIVIGFVAIEQITDYLPPVHDEEDDDDVHGCR